MKKVLAILLVVVGLFALAVPFVAAQSAQTLNTNGRCIQEGRVYNYDDLGEEGIRVEAYAFNSAIIYSEYTITRSEFEAIATGEDEMGTFVIDGFVGGEGDIQFWVSNNNTPYDLTDDYATILIRTVNNPETDACLFVFDSFDNPVVTVFEQYPDGTTSPVDVWLNSGS